MTSVWQCPVDDCNRSFDTKKGRSRHLSASHSDAAKRNTLIEELRRYADEFGRTPSVQIYQEDGQFGRDIYENEFGSWSNALDVAGLGKARQFEHEEGELIAELQRLHDELGRTPARQHMDEHGKYGRNVYETRFGTWNDALRAAGLELNHERNYSRERLIQAIRDLAEELDAVPRRDQMRNEGKFAEKPYRREFGTWNQALRAAGYDPVDRKNIPREELLNALKNLADRLGKTPTANEMNTIGEFSHRTMELRFGSWNQALQEAGLDLNFDPSRPQAQYGPGWTKSKRELIREREDFECYSCSITQADHIEHWGSKLNVHHIVPAKEFSEMDSRANEPANLVALCKGCHADWEYSRGYCPPGENLPAVCDPPDPNEMITLSDY